MSQSQSLTPHARAGHPGSGNPWQRRAACSRQEVETEETGRGRARSNQERTLSGACFLQPDPSLQFIISQWSVQRLGSTYGLNHSLSQSLHDLTFPGNIFIDTSQRETTKTHEHGSIQSSCHDVLIFVTLTSFSFPFAISPLYPNTCRFSSV